MHRSPSVSTSRPVPFREAKASTQHKGAFGPDALDALFVGVRGTMVLGICSRHRTQRQSQHLCTIDGRFIHPPHLLCYLVCFGLTVSTVRCHKPTLRPKRFVTKSARMGWYFTTNVKHNNLDHCGTQICFRL